MSDTDIFSEDVLNSISENLVALPERIRDENNGRYCYPEQYQNKIFRHGNKFLLFNNVSYEELSFDHVKFLLTYFDIINSKRNNLPSNVDEIFKLLSDNFDNLSNTVSEMEQKINLLKTSFLENINNTLQIVNNRFDEIETTISDISNTPKENDTNLETINSLKDDITNLNSQFVEFNNIKTKLNELIQNYDAENNEFKNQLELINHQIATINPNEISEEKLVLDIGDKIWKKLEDNLPEKTSQNNLPVQYEEFKTWIENKIDTIEHRFDILVNGTQKNINEIVPNEYQFQTQNNDIIHKICQLKLAGYSIEDIITLKNNNIL